MVLLDQHCSMRISCNRIWITNSNHTRNWPKSEFQNQICIKIPIHNFILHPNQNSNSHSNKSFLLISFDGLCFHLKIKISFPPKSEIQGKFKAKSKFCCYPNQNHLLLSWTVVEHYNSRGKVRKIDTRRPTDEVFHIVNCMETLSKAKSDEVDVMLMGKESSAMDDTVGVKLMMIGASIGDLEVGGSPIESVRWRIRRWWKFGEEISAMI